MNNEDVADLQCAVDLPPYPLLLPPPRAPANAAAGWWRVWTPLSSPAISASVKPAPLLLQLLPFLIKPQTRPSLSSFPSKAWTNLWKRCFGPLPPAMTALYLPFLAFYVSKTTPTMFTLVFTKLILKVMDDKKLRTASTCLQTEGGEVHE